MGHLSRPLSFDEYALIIEAMYFEHGQSSLQAMCLAHRSFLPSCQKILFKHIWTYSLERLGMFSDILEVSPHLADYVQFLFFQFTTETALTNSSGSSVKAVQGLDKLHNLRDLRIHSAPRYNPGCDWKTLDPGLCNALLRLIHSPTLEHLSLSKFQNFPLRGVLGLQDSLNLKVFLFGGLNIDPDTSFIPESGELSSHAVASVRLSQLSDWGGSVSAMEVFVGGEISPFRNSPVFNAIHLTSFGTDWLQDRDARAGKAMIRSASNLERLYCCLPRYSLVDFEGLAESILAGPFGTLCSLSFNMSENIFGHDSFNSCVSELQKLAGKINCLETLRTSIEFHTNPDADFRGLLEDIEVKCADLDDCLGTNHCNTFPSLHSVDIYFDIFLPDGRDHLPTTQISALNEQFQQLSDVIEQRNFGCLKAIEPQIDLRFRMRLRWE